MRTIDANFSSTDKQPAETESLYLENEQRSLRRQVAPAPNLKDESANFNPLNPNFGSLHPMASLASSYVASRLPLQGALQGPSKYLGVLPAVGDLALNCALENGVPESVKPIFQTSLPESLLIGAAVGLPTVPMKAAGITAGWVAGRAYNYIWNEFEFKRI